MNTKPTSIAVDIDSPNIFAIEIIYPQTSGAATNLSHKNTKPRRKNVSRSFKKYE